MISNEIEADGATYPGIGKPTLSLYLVAGVREITY